MRACLAALSLALLAPGGTAWALPAPQAAPGDSQELKLAAGRQLAQVAQPEVVVIEAAVRGFEQAFRRAHENAPPSRRWAGSIEPLLPRLQPVVAAEFRGRLPALWDAMASIYASNLTLAEMERARLFYSSATGRKFIRLMNLQPADRTADGALSVAEHVKATGSAAEQAAMALTPSEQAELIAFVTRDEQAIGRVTPKLMEQVVAWVNQPLSRKGEERMRAIAAELASGAGSQR